MWATGRYTFGLSEEEFWEMCPGMWVALHDARYETISIYDSFQARISAMIASSIPRKSKKKIRDSNYRLFPDKSNKRKRSGANLLDKMRMFADQIGVEVRRK